MAAAPPTAHESSLLMGATMVLSMTGIFTAFSLFFTNIDNVISIAAAILVGIVGIIRFVRHSLYYQSGHIHMGWRQDHPEFPFEEGMPTLRLASRH